MTHNQDHTRAIDYALAHERAFGIDHSVMPARAANRGSYIDVTTRAFDGTQRLWEIFIDHEGAISGRQV